MLIRIRATRRVAAGAAIALAALMVMPQPQALAARAIPLTPSAPGISRANAEHALVAGRLAPAGFPSGAATKLDAELQQAWQITQGNGVLVAVLSTGVSAVSGLAGKVTSGPDYAPVANPDMTDGTVLASAIAGAGPTGTSPNGPIGRAPAARILSVRIGDSGTSAAVQQYTQEGAWQSLLAKGIRYAVDHGAAVIVAGEDGQQDTSDLESAVAYAISRNVPVITVSDYAALNGGSAYPDSLPGVIPARGVVLSDGVPIPGQAENYASDEFALVSEPENSLLAFGPGDAPDVVYNGYSAVAWLAGTVALMKAVYPKIPPSMIARALALSADYAPPGGYSTDAGFGLINPAGALRQAAQLMKSVSPGGVPAGAVAPAAHVSPGSAPGVINAVRHSTAVLGGYAGAVVAGFVLLALAFLLRRRWRRSPLPVLAEAQLPVQVQVQAPVPGEAQAPDLVTAVQQLPMETPAQMPGPVREADGGGHQGLGESGEHPAEGTPGLSP